MELFIDERRVDVSMPEVQSLEEAVRHVQHHLCGPGRLVVGMRCDGKEIPAAGMAETLARPVAEVARVDVITGTRRDLVVDAMTHASQLLQEAQETCERVAGLLVEGKTQEGIETLGECTRAWQQIHEALLQSLRMLDSDVAGLKVRDMTFEQALERPREALLQIRQSLQAGDYVTLADVLQYEFAEATELWQAMMAMVRRLAEELPQSGDAST
ncbi:MAG: hypothetical protein J5J06_01050 [Phycisphaerae bacterium]|nr:hypothetical protein [Phycisphaerae bacterium]